VSHREREWDKKRKNFRNINDEFLTWRASQNKTANTYVIEIAL